MVLFLSCIETTDIIKQTNKKRIMEKKRREKKGSGEVRSKIEKRVILYSTLRFPKSVETEATCPERS